MSVLAWRHCLNKRCANLQCNLSIQPQLVALEPLERLNLLAGLITPWCPSKIAGGGGWREGVTILDPNKQQKMDKCNTLEIYLFCDVFKLMVIPACLKGSTQAKKKERKIIKNHPRIKRSSLNVFVGAATQSGWLTYIGNHNTDYEFRCRALLIFCILCFSVQRMTPSCCTLLCTLGTTVGL